VQVDCFTAVSGWYPRLWLIFLVAGVIFKEGPTTFRALASRGDYVGDNFGPMKSERGFPLVNQAWVPNRSRVKQPRGPVAKH
jgi:hypothetical protein